jgi:hypothetical protein
MYLLVWHTYFLALCTTPFSAALSCSIRTHYVANRFTHSFTADYTPWSTTSPTWRSNFLFNRFSIDYAQRYDRNQQYHDYPGHHLLLKISQISLESYSLVQEHVKINILSNHSKTCLINVPKK